MNNLTRLRQFLKVSVRGRVVIASFALALILFVLTTPLLSWFGDVFSKPSAPGNIRVEQTNNILDINWNRSEDFDASKYIIELNSQEFEVDSNVDNSRQEIEEYPVNLSIYTKDIFGLESTEITHTFAQPEIKDFVNEVNLNTLTSSAAFSSLEIFIYSFLIGLLTVFLTVYIYGFIVDNFKSLVLSLYPAVICFPLLLFMISFLNTEETEVSRLFLSGLFSFVYYIISYFVLLTANILNTSVKVKIPLEQAAKASQFIFSLISTYLVLILFFGSNYNFIEKNLLILPFVAYLTFSSVLMVNEEKNNFNKSISKTASITLTIFFAIFVFSIWPISYIYAILAIAVCFYILLSISLEVRNKLNKYVWIEYTTLICLITLLLLVNSFWGINGTLI